MQNHRRSTESVSHIFGQDEEPDEEPPEINSAQQSYFHSTDEELNAGDINAFGESHDSSLNGEMKSSLMPRVLPTMIPSRLTLNTSLQIDRTEMYALSSAKTRVTLGETVVSRSQSPSEGKPSRKRRFAGMPGLGMRSKKDRQKIKSLSTLNLHKEKVVLQVGGKQPAKRGMAAYLKQMSINRLPNIMGKKRKSMVTGDHLESICPPDAAKDAEDRPDQTMAWATSSNRVSKMDLRIIQDRYRCNCRTNAEVCRCWKGQRLKDYESELRKPGISEELLEIFRTNLKYDRTDAAEVLKFKWANAPSLQKWIEIMRNPETSAAYFTPIKLSTSSEETKKMLELIFVELKTRFYQESRVEHTALKPLTALSFDGLMGTIWTTNECTMGLFKALTVPNNKLFYLDLLNISVRDDGVEFISKHLNQTSLIDLNLSGCGITEVGMGDFESSISQGLAYALRKNFTLESLCLSSNDLGVLGIKSLFKGLAENHALKVLDLSRNNLGSEGGFEVANFIENYCNLQVLLLNHNNIQDEAGARIGNSISRNKSLRRLHLEYNNLGEKTFTSFVQSLVVSTAVENLRRKGPYNKTLIEVNLQNNPLLNAQQRAEIDNLVTSKERRVLVFERNTVRWSRNVEMLAQSDAGAATIAYAIHSLTPDEIILFRQMIKNSEVTKPDQQTLMEALNDNSMPTSGNNRSIVRQTTMIQSRHSKSAPIILSKLASRRRQDQEQDAKNMGSLLYRLPRKVQAENDSSCQGFLACMKALVEVGEFDLRKYDTAKRRYLDTLRSHRVPEIRNWANRLVCFAGKYRLDSSIPCYVSETCTVKFGRDIDSQFQDQVAIKMMVSEEHLKRERDARTWITAAGVEKYVLPIRGYGFAGNDKYAEPGRPHFIVMIQAERSLFDVINTEMIAAVNLKVVRHIAKCAAESLRFINDQKVVHGDFKPRNFVRVAKPKKANLSKSKSHRPMESLLSVTVDSEIVPSVEEKNKIVSETQWRLIDFDSAARHGSFMSEKYSSAYYAPEMARSRLVKPDRRSPPIRASEKLDVWSFGVVLYELLTGTPLFVSNKITDDLFSRRETIELLNWLVIDEERLGRVRFEPFHENLLVNQFYKEAGKELLSKCLVGDPEKRSCFAEILGHSFFFSMDKVERILGPTKTFPTGYFSVCLETHFFLSHLQSQASGAVKDIYFNSRELGCSSWLDVKATNLTVKGMHDGIRNAKAFILLLTENALRSPFVLMELMWAIDLNKPFICVVEEDFGPDSHPFDPTILELYGEPSFISALSEQIGPPSNLQFEGVLKRRLEEYSVKFEAPAIGTDTSLQDLLSKDVRDFIERHISLDKIIPYRRRNFETKAMMHRMMIEIGLITYDNLINGLEVNDSYKLDDLALDLEFVVLFGPLSTEEEDDAYQELSTGIQNQFPSHRKPIWKEFSSDESLSSCDLVPNPDLVRIFLVFLTPGFFKSHHGANMQLIESVTKSNDLSLIAVERHWFSRSKTERKEEMGKSSSYDSIMMNSEVMTFRSSRPRLYEHEAMLAELRKRIMTLASVEVKISEEESLAG